MSAAAKLSLPKEWYGLWIDGKEVESISKRSFDIENPADGSVIARVAGLKAFLSQDVRCLLVFLV